MTLTEFLLARFAEDEEAFYAELREKVGETSRLWVRLPRPLREVEAKRRIAALHANRYDLGDCASCAEGWQDLTTGEAGHNPEMYPCLTLRALALPYSDHPDCRDEWRP